MKSAVRALAALACPLALAAAFAGAARAEEPGLRVEAEAAPRRAYVGQRVTLTYMLVREPGPTGLLRPVRDVRLVAAPRFPSFWVNELQTDDLQEPPAAAVLRRFRLFPLAAGRLRVEPPTYGMVAYPTSLESLYTDPVDVAVEAEPAEVEVAPLPDAGRPGTFGGAVGRFAVSASVAARGRAGEIARVEVEVRGDGNLEATGAPRLDAVAGARVFEARRLSVDLGLESPTGVGRAVWTLDVIPERGGRLALGAVALDYFDPESGRYAVARSAPLAMEVADARPAAETARPAAARGLGLTAWLGIAALAAAALALAAVAVRAVRAGAAAPAPARDERAETAARADVARLRVRLAETLARAEAARREGDARAMHARLVEAVGDVMASLYGVAPSALSRAAIVERLSADGVAAPVVDRLARLYDHCLEAGYAPGAPGAEAAPVEAAARMLEALVARPRTQSRPR